MKMKKILCSILSASLIAASLAVPVLADYTEPDPSYDIMDVNNSAEQVCGGEATKVFTTNIDTTKEFYLGFDFKFDAATGSSIEIRSNASSNATGPIITISSAGQLQTQTGGSSYTALGAVSADTWYRAEIEGQTGNGNNLPTFRLYDSSGTLIKETEKCNMRNLGSNNRVFNYMQATNVTVKNILLVAEKPDTIAVSSADDVSSIDAGGGVALDYEMTRLGKVMNKYAVEWSVYNEANTAPLADDGVSITSGGVLSADINAGGQTVTVRASATFGDKELYGSKKITINSVDTTDEKFDVITVSGSESIKAGTSETYTFTATKNGTDVTNTITNADVVWEIYDGAGVLKNDNKNISAANGVLNVDASVIPQNITVRASSTSGKIYGSAPVSITWADSQKESVLDYDACETSMANMTFVNSPDGSHGYQTNGDLTYTFGDQSEYVITDVDIKFGSTEGAGLTLLNAKGDENSNIRSHSGGLYQQTGGSKWTPVITSDQYDPDAWYHIEFLYLSGNESGYKIYKYGSDGEMTLAATMLNCNRRNDKAYGRITFSPGVAVDNLKIAVASPDSIKLTPAHTSMFPTEENQMTVVVSRNGLPINSVSGITYEVLDAKELPIVDGTLTISEAGLLKASAMAAEQTVTVKASTATASDTVEIEIKSSEIFKMQNIGVNEDGDKVVKLYVKKLLAYDDDVVFVMAFYDENHILKEIRTLKGYGSNYTNIGEDNVNEVTVDWAIPSGFDKTTGEAKVFIWTAF